MPSLKYILMKAEFGKRRILCKKQNKKQANSMIHLI